MRQKSGIDKRPAEAVIQDIRRATRKQLGRKDLDRDWVRELSEKLTGDQRKHPSGRQVPWFVEGAQAVWEEVEDRI